MTPKKVKKTDILLQQQEQQTLLKDVESRNKVIVENILNSQKMAKAKLNDYELFMKWIATNKPQLIERFNTEHKTKISLAKILQGDYKQTT